MVSHTNQPFNASLLWQKLKEKRKEHNQKVAFKLLIRSLSMLKTEAPYLVGVVE